MKQTQSQLYEHYTVCADLYLHLGLTPDHSRADHIYIVHKELYIFASAPKFCEACLLF